MPLPSKSQPKFTSTQTYSLAHTAQCKLHMSAKDPDRNLRFMLGHAFLLDKALYRVAEIEDEELVKGELGAEGEAPSQLGGALAEGDADEVPERDNTEEDVEGQSGSLAGGKVKFDGSDGEETAKAKDGVKAMPGVKKAGDTTADGDRTPPDDFDDYDLDDGADAGGGGLGLTRFASASGAPPRMIPDEGDEEEPEEAISPPALPADLDVGTLIAGPESEDMGELYELVRGCPCHGGKAEKGKKFWEVKSGAGEVGKPGKRMAIMQVEA